MTIAAFLMLKRTRPVKTPFPRLIKARFIGTKSMQNTSAYEEPRSSGKRLHEYSFDPRSIH